MSTGLKNFVRRLRGEAPGPRFKIVSDRYFCPDILAKHKGVDFEDFSTAMAFVKKGMGFASTSDIYQMNAEGESFTITGWTHDHKQVPLMIVAIKE